MPFPVFIETPDKHHLSVKMAKFEERRPAIARVNDSRIKLSDHVHHPSRREIDVPPAGIARIRKELRGTRAAPLACYRHGEVEPGKEWIGRQTHDGQAKAAR